MDNLPNLQRSVGKFFDSRKKSQKNRQKQENNEKATTKATANENITTTTTTTSIDAATTTTKTYTNSKCTGAIKKQTRFFHRNNSIDNDKVNVPKHCETTATTTTTTTAAEKVTRIISGNNTGYSTTAADRLVARFRRLQANAGTHRSLDLTTESIDTVRITPYGNVRPGHIALTQLRSFDGHYPLQLHDSPDEPTPPEFAYQHLGSVATTNSNTSLESNYADISDTYATTTTTTTTTTTAQAITIRTATLTTTATTTTATAIVSSASTSNACYWAWQQTIATVATTATNTHSVINNNNNNNNSNNNSSYMGSNLSGRAMTNATTTATTTNNTMATTATTESVARIRRGGRSPLLKMPVIKQLSAQQITAMDVQDELQMISQAAIATTTITTSATATTTTSITKSNSKPPSRSGSASKLMSFLFKSSNESNKSLQGQSNEGFTASSHGSSSGEWEYLGAVGGTIYNARGLEIDSLPEEPQTRLECDEAGSYFQYTLSSPNNPFIPEIVARSYHSNYDNTEYELPPNTNVSLMRNNSQLPTPAYSRAGSQESTHSDGAYSDNVSPASHTSSGAGRQRRKLFSLQSPRFLQQRQEPASTTAAATAGESIVISAHTTSSSEHSSFIRSLNPFSMSYRRASSHGTSPKRKLQQASTSSSMAPLDMQAKREEFLRATMKICLVVSPPNTKLQMKSKSLTHLDGLDSTNAYAHDDKSTVGPQSESGVALANAPLAAGKLNHTESGSEYFQISFCLDPNAPEDEELIPVKKGMKLANALTPALKKRNLSFSKITIIDHANADYLDTDNIIRSLKKNSSVEHLAGHHLIITQRDDNRKTTLQKAASFGARSRPARLLSSASTEETSEPVPSTSAGNKVKHRWSGLFGYKNAQYAQLCDILNTYSCTGVPQQPETIVYLDHPNFADAMQYLSNMHTSWTDFIEYDKMNDNDKRIQTAIWELVTTEIYYIQTLQTVTNLFLACLLALQEQHILTEIDQIKLFSNVREICFANLHFWTISLYPMVAHSVATREPMRIVFFQQGFASFGALFAPYKRYCAEQSTCQYYCRELNRNNVLFTSYLAWCEAHKMCNRLRLADILVRPMQRLTKYSLLLTAIRKQLYNMQEVELVDYMIQSVENFVCSVNSHLTIRQEHERLKGVMARIESYDVVPETHNEHLDRMLRQFSRMFDLCMPMKGCPAHHVRHLFMEGDQKYKDYTGKIDVHCFLMTDMLIVCKPMSKKTVSQLKVIRQPYITDRLAVHLQNNVLSCVYLNEYQGAVTAFTLTSLEARSWHDALKRARNIYTKLKQSDLNIPAAVPHAHLPVGLAAPNFVQEFSSTYAPQYAPNYTNMFSSTSSSSAVPMYSATLETEGGPALSNILASNCDASQVAANTDALGMLLRKSPLSSSSVCSHISSTNASKSGSVEWNESRNISVEMEKTNSLSSDEGAANSGTHGVMAAFIKGKNLLTGHKQKLASSTANRLSVQPPVIGHLGQSLPNLTTHQSQTNNTLLVPGTTTAHSGNMLLSPSHRGISYPPPSPTRVPLRRGLAFSNSTKNPPLVKTRNITSQNSFNWRQMFHISTTAASTVTGNPPSPQQSQQHSPLPSQQTESFDASLLILGADSKSATQTLLLTNEDIAEEANEQLVHE